MKTFLKSMMKIAMALVVAVVVLALLGGVAWKIYDSKLKSEAKEHEIAKRWSSDLRRNLGMEMAVKTKVVDGRLLMAVDFDGYPKYLAGPKGALKNRDATISVIFQDGDGFKLFEKIVPLSAFTSIVNGEGVKRGLSYEVEEFIDIDRYKRFVKLDAQWTIDTEVAPEEPTPATAAQAVALLDHCAPGISRVERMKRLGAHGKVRETGLGEFSAGLRSITLLPDGDVLNCR